MGNLRIFGGDFTSGRAKFDNISIGLRSIKGIENIPLNEVMGIQKSGREAHVDGTGTLKTAAVGGIIGGIAAGAATGGITGPVGALIGACAGAVIASKKIHPIASVTFRDGRYFVAVGQESCWLAFVEAVRRTSLQDSKHPANTSTPMQTHQQRLKISLERVFRPRLGE